MLGIIFSSVLAGAILAYGSTPELPMSMSGSEESRPQRPVHQSEQGWGEAGRLPVLSRAEDTCAVFLQIPSKI